MAIDTCSITSQFQCCDVKGMSMWSDKIMLKNNSLDTLFSDCFENKNVELINTAGSMYKTGAISKEQVYAACPVCTDTNFDS